MALNERSRTTIIGAAAIAVFLAITSFWIFDTPEPGAMNILFSPVAEVREQEFDIYVTATAELDAGRSVLLSSELPSNRAKIIFLAAEGELVAAGNTVAKFDATSFQEDIQKIEHSIEEQNIKLQQARADLALHETGSEDRAAQLEHKIKLAQLKLDSLTEGSIPLRVAQAEKELRRANGILASARQSYATEAELYAKGLSKQKTLTELKEREQEAVATQRIAAQQLQSLNEITLPAERRQAELQLQNSQREVVVYKSTYKQQSKKQVAAIAQIENKIRSLEQELQRTRGYLTHTELKAPVSGLVLYKTMSIQGEKRKVQVGDSLWNHHGFAVIPDLSSMVAHVEISESEVGKLAAGQTVLVRPEAYPKLSLTGTVQSVGTLASSEGTQNDKKFRVKISLDETDARLRPGMSARASILVHSFAQAVLVPVEAVFYEGQATVVFVWRDGDPLQVPVRLGHGDGKYMVVEEGLEAGQEVMLVYPDTFEAGSDVAR